MGTERNVIGEVVREREGNSKHYVGDHALSWLGLGRPADR